jgi:hypothetical protein
MQKITNLSQSALMKTDIIQRDLILHHWVYGVRKISGLYKFLMQFLPFAMILVQTFFLQEIIFPA